MLLEIQATADIDDVVIESIEMNTPEGIILVAWDSSEILRTNSGFEALYRGVYFNGEYANGQINRLIHADLSSVQLYSEHDVYEGFFELIGCLEFYDGTTSISIPMGRREFKITTDVQDKRGE